MSVARSNATESSRGVEGSSAVANVSDVDNKQQPTSNNNNDNNNNNNNNVDGDAYRTILTKVYALAGGNLDQVFVVVVVWLNTTEFE